MSDWKGLLVRMDGAGPPLKKACIKKKAPLVKQAPLQLQPGFKEDYFAIHKHGYYLVKGQLMYRTPHGEYLPATGVDEFGPFKDPPRDYNPYQR